MNGELTKKAIFKTQLNIQEWLNFWESLDSPGRMAWLLGGMVLLLAGIAFGFVGSKRIQYAREFYPITISADYLEGIMPGSKIRYQGALIVGEVVGLESDGRNHFIKAKIKKDFYIPQQGSQISLSTWGYFGSPFLNIDILESARNSEPYPPHAVIPMEKAVNSSVILQKAYDYIKSPEGQKSLLEKQLFEIKKISQEINQAAYLKPKNVRAFVKEIVGKAYLFFSGMRDLGNQFYITVNELNQISEDLTSSIEKSIARLRELSEAFYRMVGYENPTWPSRVLHQETDYEELANFLNYAKEKSAVYKKEPYRIFFE